MNKEIFDFLRGTFLFKGISEDDLTTLCRDLRVESALYKKQTDIFLPSDTHERIAFIMYGGCLVERIKPNGESIPLNLLTSGASFGIQSVFSSEDFPTRVRAIKETEVLFIERGELVRLIESSPAIAFNVISFLSGKIYFLTKKIATFSSDTTYDRVASHLYMQYLRSESDQLELNCKRTAEALNIGRASLYRALQTLCDEGIIKFETKKIYITDPMGLERISK